MGSVERSCVSIMTPQAQLIELAKLDGWHQGKCDCGCSRDWLFEDEKTAVYESSLPAYLTSYDAIIPLVQKMDEDIQLKVARTFVHTPNTFVTLRDVRVAMLSSPAFIAEALLRATSKWTEY